MQPSNTEEGKERQPNMEPGSGIEDQDAAQTIVVNPRLLPFQEHFPRIVRTFKPQNEVDVVDMVTILGIVTSQHLTDENLLNLVKECDTKRAIAKTLGTLRLLPGLAFLLAGVIAPLLGIQPTAVYETPEEVFDVIDGIKQMDWTAEPRPGAKVDLPPLNVSSQQRDRFSDKFTIYREEFEQVYKVVAAELDQRGKKDFRNSMPVWVHGPIGIGKSHALRYVAARLWRERLCNGGDFRVLYIAQWHEMSFASLQAELKLCFHDDPIMLRKIHALKTAAHVPSLMFEYRALRVVVIVDQAHGAAFDNTDKFNSALGFFEAWSANARFVVASLPRFQLQGYYLQDDPRYTTPVQFMATLTPRECAAMILHRNDEALEAIQMLLQPLADCSHEVWNDLVANAQLDLVTTGATDLSEQSALGCAIVQLFLEAAGGVPQYVRDLLNHYRNIVIDEGGSVALPAMLDCVRHACELFSEAQATVTQTETLEHFADIEAGLSERYLLQFLECAITYDRLRESRPIREQWSAYDLRFVRLLRADHHTSYLKVQPLCPAVFRGMSRAMMQIALETNRQDSSTLCQCIQIAIAKGVLSASAVGFAEKQIFQIKLARNTDRLLTAAPYSSPGSISPEALVFQFEHMRLIWGFDAQTQAVEKYKESGASVLFIPRKCNEAFIDAAVYNYEAKAIYAIRVVRQTVQEHQESLSFFTDASDNRWRNLVPQGEEDEWITKCMVWVQTNIQLLSTSSTSSSDTEPAHIKQFTIIYDDFVNGKICDEEVLEASKESIRLAAQAAGLSSEDISNYDYPQLQTACKLLGIPLHSKASNKLLVAKIKHKLKWELSSAERGLLLDASSVSEKSEELKAAEVDESPRFARKIWKRRPKLSYF